MVHTEAGAQARGRAGEPSGAQTPAAGNGKDAKSDMALLRPHPAARVPAAAGESVLQPWLRERKAQDLRGGQVSPQALRSLVTQRLAAPLPDDLEAVSNEIGRLRRALPSPLPALLLQAVLAAARDAACRAPDFASGCHLAYHVLQGTGEVTADERGEQHLHRLLAGVLAFDEASPEPAILFASWLRLVVTHISEEGLVPFVLRALDAHPPRSAQALAHVAGHLALHALRELKDRPDQVFLQTGQALSWLLRQDGAGRAEGLGGFGDGLHGSRHFSPRLLCEVLQAIAAARDEIRDRKAGPDVRAMVDRLAGGEGWRGSHAKGVVQALAGGPDATAGPLPREEAVATVRGLVDATLHPGLAPQALAGDLVPWQALLALPVLAGGDLEDIGHAVGARLGGPEITPALLSALSEGLACQDGMPARAGAALRGLVRAAGGRGIDDALLAAMATGLAKAPARGSLPLALALVDAVGALGSNRAQALPALKARLERLLPAPWPDTWRTALALASDPLGALAQEGLPPQARQEVLEAAYAHPGLVDAAMVERQLWGCAVLAVTDLPLALEAARQLLRHAGALVTPAAFRELRAALLPQARLHQEAMADLYACFARHGDLAPSPTAMPARKAGARPGKAHWQHRQSTSHRRHDAASAFLREEAALLARGMARVAFEPLARSLEAQALTLAADTERKR